ncbi:peroxide stress protein YaaA [Rhodocyclus tenuis]|uniref:YaaA family protein n=1 Tax=Rhodocyclus gracilis TaxID=2929842 RepID=UPI001298D0FF|nr:YaaA family protein [Rhodocyclus gracilis]MRD73603.1 peroxide stress protein YaaA [Rhodocyclus gracilis]
MIIVLSPAKTLDLSPPPLALTPTAPAFLDEARLLVERLRAMSPAQLGSLMGISDTLASLNATRFADWGSDSASTALPAVFAFNGDVYEGLAARSLSADDLQFAQRHLRILSGLYGVLRPLDRMEAYRLEMGTRLDTPRGKDLYAFWGEHPARAIEALAQEIAPEMAQESEREMAPGVAQARARTTEPANGALPTAQTLVNLASEEYFKVLARHCRLPVVQPVFEDWSAGRFKVVSFFAKRARGLMARYAILHRLRDAADLHSFAEDGYAFAPEVSDAARWVFRRRSV